MKHYPDAYRSHVALIRLAGRVARRFAIACESVCQQISESQSLLDHHDRKKGNRFEHEVAERLRSLGYEVHGRYDSKHDMVVNGFRVQCKRKDVDSVSLCTTPIVGREYCGYSRDDWDVLVLRRYGVTYVIPADVLVCDDNCRIRNHIKPDQYSEWIDRWDVFGGAGKVTRHTQKVLFW